jgi:hypothetical protein
MAVIPNPSRLPATDAVDLVGGNPAVSGPGQARLANIGGVLNISVNGAPYTAINGAAAAAVWVDQGGGAFRLQPLSGATPVPARIQTNPVGSDVAGDGTIRALQLLVTQMNADVGAGSQALVGIVIGGEVGAGNFALENYAKDVTIPGNVGLQSSIIPILVQGGNPIIFATHGAPKTITRHAHLVMPNSGLFTDGSGGVLTIGRACTFYIEGAPDTSDANVVITDKASMVLDNDPLHVGDGIRWGQNANSSGYEDFTGGGSPAVSAAGHIRRAYNPATGGQQLSVNGGAWRIWPALVPHYQQFDPAAQAYPAGDTVVFTTIPSDNPVAGLSSFDPKRFTLPPAIAIAGGNLFPWIRFTFANGSSTAAASIYINATGSTVATPANAEYLAVNSPIVKTEFIVKNTSGSTSSSQDIGLFQCESMAL